MPPARFIQPSKNIPPIEYLDSIRTGSNLLAVCCSSFVFCSDFSVGRLFPLPSASIAQT